MSESATKLEYEPRQSFVRRRGMQFAIFGVALVTALLLVVYRVSIQRYVSDTKFLWQQQRWLDYTIDSDRVVYDEDAAKAAQLPSDDGYVRYPSDSGRVYALWRPSITEPPMQNYSMPQRALLFMHERQTEIGQRLLLVVYAHVTNHEQLSLSPGDHLVFSMEEFHIADRNNHVAYRGRNGWLATIPGLDLIDRDKPLRLFGGQVDPNDPTHFTIRYQLGAKEGLIDGYEAEGKQGEFGRKEPGLGLQLREEKRTGSPK